MNRNENIDKLKAAGVNWVMRIGTTYYLLDANLNKIRLKDYGLIVFVRFGGVHPKRPRTLVDINEFRNNM